METLHKEIHRLKDQAWEKILEEEKLHSDACLDIFEDEEWEKLLPIEVVVENFKKTLEEVSSEKHIRQAFRIEEALLELDTKLRDFCRNSNWGGQLQTEGERQIWGFRSSKYS